MSEERVEPIVKNRKSASLIKAKYICDRVVSVTEVRRSYFNLEKNVTAWIEAGAEQQHLLLTVNGAPVLEHAELSLETYAFLVRMLQGSMRSRTQRREEIMNRERERPAKQKEAA